MLDTELLSNLRVVDLGTIVAGPQCAALLSDFGAEVIKIEPPDTPDNARRLSPTKDGVSLWWKVLARNKKSATLNLKSDEGKHLFAQIIAQTDVLIENFRPGVLDRLGFTWEDLQRINPNLILLRISGFGQTGPMSKLPSFGRAAEAFSGAQYLTGFPDGPPVHAGFSLADSITALMGAYAISMALYERERNQRGGQMIDLGLYETLFKIVEFPVIAYDQLKYIPERVGNRHPGFQPINTYRSKDGKWVTISSANDRAAFRFLKAIGGEQLAKDPRFATNDKRVENADELDQLIWDWMLSKDGEEIEDILRAHDATYSLVYNIKDLYETEQIWARENIITVEDADLGEVKMPGIVPKFSRTPGKVRHTGPNLGEHNYEIYGELCGLSKEQIDVLKDQGVI